jgi:hypothetical protein
MCGKDSSKEEKEEEGGGKAKKKKSQSLPWKTFCISSLFFSRFFFS